MNAKDKNRILLSDCYAWHVAKHQSHQRDVVAGEALLKVRKYTKPQRKLIKETVDNAKGLAKQHAEFANGIYPFLRK